MRAVHQLHCGIVAPLDRANVDTDLIIPKQFLKSIRRSGFGPNLFDGCATSTKACPMDCSRRPLNPDFRAEPAALQGARVYAGTAELRLRFEPRACPLGARSIMGSAP
jgi:3-isopropylmalate/(R)-2-methylmalate dehydratase small subunit